MVLKSAKAKDCRGRRIGEENLAIEGLREKFVEIDEIHFAAEAENMRTVNPGDGVHGRVIVLLVGSVGLRRGTNLEARTPKRKFVDAAGDVAHRAIDAQVRISDRGIVNGGVVDVHDAEARLVDDCGREQMRFGQSEESVARNRQRVGKIQVGCSNAAAERGLQSASAKRFKG